MDEEINLSYLIWNVLIFDTFQRQLQYPVI